MTQKIVMMKSGATSATGSPGLTGTDPLGGMSGNTNDGTDPSSRSTDPLGRKTVTTKGATDGTKGTSFKTEDNVKETNQTLIIRFIMEICGFPEDSTMAKLIDQQEWSEIHHVTSISIHEIKELHAFSDSGLYEGKPLSLHLCMLQGFILYHRRRSRDLCSQLDEHDTMSLIEKKDFKAYMNNSK
jgi:hypothetical protein